MSKAYKCDACRKFYDRSLTAVVVEPTINTGQGRIIVRFVPSWEEDYMKMEAGLDICLECMLQTLTDALEIAK